MLRHRRHEKEVECPKDDRKSDEISQSASLSFSPIAGTKHRRAAVLLLITSVSLYLLPYQWRNQDRIDLSLFLNCRQIGDDVNESASPCVYFRPSRYFANQQQQHLALDSFNDIRWSMWGKQVSNFYVPRDRTGPSPPSKFLDRHGITSVSTIMMPKVASRSIEALFNDRLAVSLEVRARLKIKGLRVGIATPNFWKQLAERQEHAPERQTDIVFALVRDPVSRFLSSLAQTLSTFMQSKYKACSDLWKPCLESSSSYKELVQCAIDSMKQQKDSSPYYFDQHVVPQAAFLAGSLQRRDVEIAVFHIQHLELILQAFGMTKSQHMNTREEKTFDHQVLVRFGDELVNSHKAREALDESMIKDICELYAVDVNMMHHLGFSAGDCDFMRKKENEKRR